MGCENTSMTFWHVLNRGVEKRDIFLDSSDRVRFVHNLYEFNDSAPAMEYVRRPDPDVGPRRSHIREPIVSIHAWCLRPNHYHLLLSEREESGLTRFLMKLNVGYAKYFNERYEREGSLFQGRTKKVLVERGAQFNYLPHYIHLNALDELPGAERWRFRDGGVVENVDDAYDHLGKYRWSSYLDYTGKKNFPSVLTPLWTPKKYADSLREYLESAAERDDEDSRGRAPLWLEQIPMRHPCGTYEVPHGTGAH